jgi:hypothetical protein
MSRMRNKIIFAGELRLFLLVDLHGELQGWFTMVFASESGDNICFCCELQCAFNFACFCSAPSLLTVQSRMMNKCKAGELKCVMCFLVGRLDSSKKYFYLVLAVVVCCWNTIKSDKK